MEAEQEHGPTNVKGVALVLEVSHLLGPDDVLNCVEGRAHEE